MNESLAGFKAVARVLGLRRRLLVDARLRCERNLIPALRLRRPVASAKVLCYHSVGTEEWGVNDVPVALFKRQLELALSLGYRFVPAEAVAAGHGEQRDLAVTFDDGLMSVFQNAAPILADLGIPWSLFVVCDWAGRDCQQPRLFMGWDEISQVASAGVSIGSHSMTHPDFGRLSEADARAELADSRRVIREHGLEVDSFAIPFGQSGNWDHGLSELARSVGYRTIYAQAVETRAGGTVPRTFVSRFDEERVFKAVLEGVFDHWEEPL